MPSLLTPTEVAHLLSVTPRTVQRYAREGRLARIKIGNRLSRYTRASVEQLIAPENLTRLGGHPDASEIEGNHDAYDRKRQ